MVREGPRISALGISRASTHSLLGSWLSRSEGFKPLSDRLPIWPRELGLCGQGHPVPAEPGAFGEPRPSGLPARPQKPHHGFSSFAFTVGAIRTMSRKCDEQLPSMEQGDPQRFAAKNSRSLLKAPL